MKLHHQLFTGTSRIKPELDAYRMHASEGMEIVHLHLPEGEEIGLHVNPVDVVFCVIEGQARIKAGNSELLLAKYDTADVPAGIERGMKNEGPGDLRVLVIKRTS